MVMSLKAMKGPASKILEDIEMNEQGDFSPAQIERFKSDPELYRSFIKTIEKDASGNFPIVSDL